MSCNKTITESKDATPPEIISVQLNQENPVAQIVEISCIVKDDEEIKELHLWLDGEHYNNMVDYSPPYRFDLNTTIDDEDGNPYFVENVVYNITIKAIDSSDNYSFSDEFISPISFTVDNSNSAPIIPQIISVLYSNGMNQISWTYNNEPDFKEYILKKRTISNSTDWITILQTSNQSITYFEDVDIDPFIGNEYFIRVVDEFGYYSSSQIVNSPIEGSPDPVNIISIMYNIEEMTINWEESNSNDFNSYILYHWNETFLDDNYEIVAVYNNKNILSHSLNFNEADGFTPIIQNWFKIEVTDTFNLSNFGLPFTHEIDPPPIPVEIHSVDIYTGVTWLYWNKSNEDDVVGYEILKDGDPIYGLDAQNLQIIISYINDNDVEEFYFDSPEVDYFIPVTYDIITKDYWGQSTANSQGYQHINLAPVAPEFFDIDFSTDSITFTWSFDTTEPMESIVPISDDDSQDFEYYKVYHSTVPDFSQAEEQFLVYNSYINSYTISFVLNNEPRYDFSEGNYFWIEITDYWGASTRSNISGLFDFNDYELPEPVNLYAPYFTTSNEGEQIRSFKLRWSISDNIDFSHYTVLKSNNPDMLNAIEIGIFGMNSLLGFTQNESEVYDFDISTTDEYYQVVITDGYSESAYSNVVRIWPEIVEWKPIPAGDFSFGAPFELQTLYLEFFEMSKYPITNVQYVKYLRDPLNTFIFSGNDLIISGEYDGEGFIPGDRTFINLSNSQIVYDGNDFLVNEGYENHPVTGITWFGSDQYCDQLSDFGFNGARLPTDEEWEKAARGLSASDYPWSQFRCSDETDEEYETNYAGSIVCDRSHCDNLESSPPCPDIISETNANYSNSNDPWDNNPLSTTPVGYYDGLNTGTANSPSYYDLYDMSGNVREWTQTLNDNGSAFILKGGAFIHSQTSNELKTWGNSQIVPENNYNYVGLRCVKE